MTALALALLLQIVPGDPIAELPRAMTLQDPKEERYPRSEPQTVTKAPASRPFVDLDWLEVTPAVGIAVYSSKYLSDPGPALTLSARAPLPWLSPASDPKGEYFGLFTELAFMTIDRDMSPTVEHRKGLASFISLGVDYSILRDSTWILIGRAGLLYAYYGDIADLSSGFGAMAGLSAGIQVSGRMGITYSPELLFGKGGSTIFLNSLGLSIQF